MNKDETLRLALEAFGEIAWSNETRWQSDRAKIAITAIKAALEAKDEPEYYGLTKDHLWMSISKEHYDRLKPEFRMACYTTQPQRTWVGLTDEEFIEIYNRVNWDINNSWAYEQAIEAKLKEKNT